MTRDHPRVCGEHRVKRVGHAGALGSSPRMRGTHVDRISLLGHLGIIPAYAGNTRLTFSRLCAIRDHPRVCGEHTGMNTGSSMPRGSSPRMRGTHTVDRWNDRVRGIIPAYAGNTYVLKPRKLKQRDHPRVCGEHGLRDNILATSPGSSPRMRGTPWWPDGIPRHPGIIPAYAGNTVVLGVLATSYGDHPRVCGEHIALCDVIVSHEGSSPRMRGTPHGGTSS